MHCRDVFDFRRHVQVTLVGCHRTSAAACKYFHENVPLQNKDVAPESTQTALHCISVLQILNAFIVKRAINMCVCPVCELNMTF